VSSLTEFAASDRTTGGQPCLTCNHPDRAEIDAGLRSGISGGAINRWLRAEGKPVVSDGALANHRRKGHHLES
jgi:hypothetical protein